ncbi:TIGR03790 family protein [Roseateles sp. BYS87W]|uniref:TIGR03790 family protein n=1 Tax=Pelomonas baiyunensis TaxID=3299026 RepID=A0ABW7GV57_9BURK
MAKAAFSWWHALRRCATAAVWLGAWMAAASPSAQPAPGWQPAPAYHARLTAASLGLVINTADPYSVAVGETYVRRRGIAADHVLRVRLPVRASLSREEFQALNQAVRAHMPEAVQALALAWVQPYAVECNALGSALALGLQPGVCADSCAATRPSPLAHYSGARTWSVLGVRPVMHIAARSVVTAQALIERGIASDHSLARADVAPVHAYLAATPDTARNVRERLFPPAGAVSTGPGAAPLDVVRVRSEALPPLRRTVLYQTGLARVPPPLGGEWLPGALADHLTSFGGQLDRPVGDGQMNVLDWIEAGATASYGTVSEPCNHLQKFPHPQVLMQAYAQGLTALEAYWRSVLWPAQGVFVGEPLAAPWASTP